MCACFHSCICAFLNVYIELISASPGKCAADKTGVTRSTVTPIAKWCDMGYNLKTSVRTQIVLTRKI